jgi:DNA-binding transcriptional LysR family regulator
MGTSQNRAPEAASLRARVCKHALNEMLDWNDLRYFLAVAREGSMLAAARALNVNQSTVQRRLAALEEAVGGKLVERHPAGYRLTDLGQRLLVQAEGVETAVAAFERVAKSGDTQLSGTVRLTCAEADMYRLLTPSLERFRLRYPDLRVEFVITERYLDLAKGEADIALRGGVQRDSALIGRKVGDVPWSIYASRAYVERCGRPVCPEDVAQHAVIAFEGQLADIAPARWFRSWVADSTIVAHSSSVLATLPAVKSGIGLALLPQHIGAPENDLLPVLDLPADLAQPITLLVHPDLRNTPRVAALFDFLVGEISNLRPLLTGGTPE